MYCPLLTVSCDLSVCAQVPILATRMGSSVKVWLAICHVFTQRVFYGGKGEGKLVTEWKLAALGLLVLLTPVPWCRLAGGRVPASISCLAVGGTRDYKKGQDCPACFRSY